jgi:hypothetical protein
MHPEVVYMLKGAPAHLAVLGRFRVEGILSCMCSTSTIMTPPCAALMQVDECGVCNGTSACSLQGQLMLTVPSSGTFRNDAAQLASVDNAAVADAIAALGAANASNSSSGDSSTGSRSAVPPIDSTVVGTADNSTSNSTRGRRRVQEIGTDLEGLLRLWEGLWEWDWMANKPAQRGDWWAPVLTQAQAQLQQHVLKKRGPFAQHQAQQRQRQMQLDGAGDAHGRRLRGQQRGQHRVEPEHLQADLQKVQQSGQSPSQVQSSGADQQQQESEQRGRQLQAAGDEQLEVSFLLLYDPATPMPSATAALSQLEQLMGQPLATDDGALGIITGLKNVNRVGLCGDDVCQVSAC